MLTQKTYKMKTEIIISYLILTMEMEIEEIDPKISYEDLT